MPLGSRLSARLAVLRLEKGVLFIPCLVCSILQPHMLSFLAKTLSQIMLSKHILLILQKEMMGV